MWAGRRQGQESQVEILAFFYRLNVKYTEPNFEPQEDSVLNGGALAEVEQAISPSLGIAKPIGLPTRAAITAEVRLGSPNRYPNGVDWSKIRGESPRM
jgi:hypothetical protein